MQLVRLPTLTFGLKSGICCGIVSISALAAVTTAITNKDLIDGEINGAAGEFKSLLEKSFEYPVEKFKTGVSSVFETYKNWYDTAYENRETIINSLSFEKLRSGYGRLGENYSSWLGASEKASGALDIVKNANENQVRTVVAWLSKVPMLSKYAFSISKSLLAQYIKDRENFKINLPDNPDFFVKAAELFDKNSEIMDKFSAEDFGGISKFMAENPSGFNAKMEELKSKNSYSNKYNLLEELLPESDFKQVLTGTMLSAYEKCKEKKEDEMAGCAKGILTKEFLEKFADKFKEQIAKVAGQQQK